MEVERQPSLLESLPGPDPAEFDGETYEAEADGPRLHRQLERVAEAMADGEWRSLAEIQDITGDPQSSISARLRDLKKEKFGRYKVDKRRRGARASGVWESRVGEKGTGEPQVRDKAQVPMAYATLAQIADTMLRHLEHRKTCAIFNLRESRPCNCGLGPSLTAYRAARKDTLRYEDSTS